MTVQAGSKKSVLVAWTVFLSLWATVACAGDNSSALRSGLYFSTDLGLNSADDLASSDASISLSSGYRLDLSMGYAFKLSEQVTLSPEFDLAVLYNSLDSITLPSGESASVSGSFTQVPLMANAVFNWQFVPHWVAYAGAGFGYDYMNLSTDSVAGNDLYLDSSESASAWQAMAGVRYKFGSTGLGLAYKYLSTTPEGMQAVGNNAVMLTFIANF